MKNKILFGLFLLSLLCFFLMNHFTGIAIDDFAYKFVFTENGPEGTRVTSIADLFESQYNHYFITNGRILLNGLAQVFLISDNKLWFNIVNTLFFAALQILIYFYIKARKGSINISLYLLFLSIIWFIIPGPNHTLLWLDGSINYLWAVVIALVFLQTHFYLACSKKAVSLIWFPCLLLFGLVAGATHEAISLGLSGALFFYYIVNRDKVKKEILPLVIGYFIGTVFITLAPGNMVRLNSGAAADSSFISLILQRVYGLVLSTPSMVAIIILIAALIFIFFYNRIKFREIISENIILLYAIILSLGFIFLAGAFQERVFFGVSIFSIIVLMSILVKFMERLNTRWVKLATIILIVIMITEYIYVIKDLRLNKQVFDNDEVTYRQSPENVFEFRDKKINRFVSTGLGGHDRFFWSNVAMANYYQKKYMIFLPSELYRKVYMSDSLSSNSFMKITNQHFENPNNSIFLAENSRFVIIPIDSVFSNKITKESYIKFESKKPIIKAELSRKDKILKILFNRSIQAINFETASCYLLETKHGNYLYFKKPSLFSIQQTKRLYIYNSKETIDSFIHFEL